MALDTKALLRTTRAELRALSNPENAVQMAAYMKTEMPFYGIKKPDRVPVFRLLRDTFKPETRVEYQQLVEALWGEPQREPKYLAIGLAVQHKRFIVPASLPLYTRLIREGAWWDFVDDVAIRLVGKLLLDHRAKMKPKLDRWVDHKDMWLRRSALISQIKHKQQTDEAWLFDICLRRAHETEFFIRKAIGWALREHAKSRPDAVRAFLTKHRPVLSGLSFREAAKHLSIS